jgi:hypothetical protein
MGALRKKNAEAPVLAALTQLRPIHLRGVVGAQAAVQRQGRLLGAATQPAQVGVVKRAGGGEPGQRLEQPGALRPSVVKPTGQQAQVSQPRLVDARWGQQRFDLKKEGVGSGAQGQRQRGQRRVAAIENGQRLERVGHQRRHPTRRSRAAKKISGHLFERVGFVEDHRVVGGQHAQLELLAAHLQRQVSEEQSVVDDEMT